MCEICGQPNYIKCNCSVAEPFCTPCDKSRDCAIKIDSSCVIYHMDDSLPSRLECINLPNLSTVESILEAIDSLICNKANIPITVTETFTAKMTANGPANHTLKTDVKVSEDTGNTIEVRPDGLYTPPIPENDHKVKVNSTDTPDYLVNQMTGAVSDWLTISVQDVNGVMVISPIIDGDALCEYINNCKCSTGITNLAKVFAAPCPPGYTLNGSETYCVNVQISGATIADTTVDACPAHYVQYSEYGAIVYEGGFDSDGTGHGATITQDLTNGSVIALPLNTVWGNAANGDDNFGPMNRAGVWDCGSSGAGSLGFSVPVSVPSTKKYYIGIAADDEYQLIVNGSTLVNTSALNLPYYNNDGGAKYRYWHIYPINLTQGVNYIGIVGVDTGGVASALAAEIYDNTLAQLQAATLKTAFTSDPASFPLDQNHYNNLNLIFSTRCARQPGSKFSIGNATCPDNTWSLDTTGGDPLVPPCQGINSDSGDWVCKKTISVLFTGYSVTLVWDRLDQAISYDVEQKLTSSSTYTTSYVSPVTNPPSGSEVSTTIDNLPSTSMNFRVRPNYGNCVGPWTEV